VEPSSRYRIEALLQRMVMVKPRAKSCSFCPRDIGCANALQCEPKSDALVDDAPQFLGQRNACVPRRERR
jgi:hypothetical protein